MNKLHLRRKIGNIHGEVSLSGSKSISNRLLLMTKLSGSTLNFKNLSDSDDTLRIQKFLEEIEVCSSSRIPLIIDAGNAGTVFRFLTAYLSLKTGKWLLTGDRRMKMRPIGGLVDALQHMGAQIEYTDKKNYPPLNIQGAELTGKQVDVDASKSSQFVTAIMLIAPYLKNGLNIKLMKDPVSFDYIQMTESLMKQCGVNVKISGTQICIEPGSYIFNEENIEPDWSSASYWYETAALSDDTDIILPGLLKNSIQGDRVCADLFKKLGVNTEFTKTGIRIKSSTDFEVKIEFDFTNHPDLVPAVMTTCAAKQINGIFHGVGHLRFKESDRIESLSAELQKIGTRLQILNDKVILTSSEMLINKKQPVFNTHNDHRLAMCLAPLVLKYNDITINDPEVVSKSYPAFWKDMKRTGMADVEKI